jgi:hypothetical protein
MKRMNVRAFRKDISSLTEEPIEVVRYSETIGFWVPQGLTLEPRVKRSTRKPSAPGSPIDLRDDELAELGRKIREIAKRVGTI